MQNLSGGNQQKVSLTRPFLRGDVKVILAENWRPTRFSNLLARQAGGAIVSLPGGIGAEKGVDDYFDLINAWVDRVSAAL